MAENDVAKRVAAALETARAALLGEKNSLGVWRGELSASALSTATAILALRAVNPFEHAELITQGLNWLKTNQLANGGWGDTIKSLPNLSTTLLCWAALGGSGEEFSEVVAKCEQWISVEAGGLEPATLAKALKLRYGKDQTFSVPIMMACAIGGRLGAAPGCWKLVPQLPFQLAAFPRKWFAALSLPVVSYALPALIAIGQVRHFHAPGGLGRVLRTLTRKKSLKLLEELQPEGGGFLEATPLTSFVTMALASMEKGRHPVAVNGAEFLKRSIRPDGGWPIDTDLATWGTTLSVKALGPEMEGAEGIAEWLISQQYTKEHPYTLSAPGGWAWTDLPGGVPDADDTSGALLALAEIGKQHPEVTKSARAGVRWLLDLQNRDGGMPTFCRGWGTLPFDRSTPEITAHALAAWDKWSHVESRIPWARKQAFDYLHRTQSPHGWWEPLWFGNQWAIGETNRVYGTASVVRDLSAVHGVVGLDSAVRFLMRVQREEGGWGGGRLGPESIEETALCVLALARYLNCGRGVKVAKSIREASLRGVNRLLELTEHGTSFPAAPIGLYFARLWYFEKLYPMIWTVAALREVMKLSAVDAGKK